MHTRISRIHGLTEGRASTPRLRDLQSVMVLLSGSMRNGMGWFNVGVEDIMRRIRYREDRLEGDDGEGMSLDERVWSLRMGMMGTVVAETEGMSRRLILEAEGCSRMQA